MGFFSSFLGGGCTGAHNANLAELALAELPLHEKKRLAETMVAMGVQSSGYRVTAEDFCNSFNKKPRPIQLNFVALALASMNIHALPTYTYMFVKNPFVLAISETDMEVNRILLRKKFKIEIPIKVERINIFEWLE
jgi:hypothetical protein